MSADPDRLALERALDAGPYALLRVLADWHEEHGEPWTAAGYRALADRRKHPVPVEAGGWAWSGTLPSTSPHSLPVEVDRVLLGTPPEPGCEGRLESATLSGAYRRAAAAWGQVLEGESRRETTRAACNGCLAEADALDAEGMCGACDGSSAADLPRCAACGGLMLRDRTELHSVCGPCRAMGLAQ